MHVAAAATSWPTLFPMIQSGIAFLVLPEDPHSPHSIQSWPWRFYARVPRKEDSLCAIPVPQPMCSRERAAWVERSDYAHRRARGHNRIPGQDDDRRGTTDLRPTLPDRRVSAGLDQRTLWATAVSLSRALASKLESTWACLGYNLARWFSLRRKFKMELAPADAVFIAHSSGCATLYLWLLPDLIRKP
jgi:hypothetical protein